MKRILVDMDGVLADVYSQFLRLEFQETGIERVIETTYGKMEADAFPYFAKHVRSKGFFAEAPLIEGSVEGLKYLNDKYEVVILSAATEFPESLCEKEAWLNRHFPFISWKQMVFCGRKDIICGDVMIDDHPKNLELFQGKKIIFTQPHNMNLSLVNCDRVFGWAGIQEIL